MIETEHGAAHAISQAELLIEINGVVSVQRLDETSYRVGRAESNQLCFPGIPGLSREHLSLECEGTHWVARDLGSTNGSTVNGERISEQIGRAHV